MLQYAVSNAPQAFQRSVFAEPLSRSQDSHNGGYNIPRPPSTASQTSSSGLHRQASFSSGIGLGDSSLSTLATLAANAPAAAPNNTSISSQSGENTRSSTPNSSTAMSQNAPAATAGYGTQNGSAPPICANCQTSVTPLWRRDESGSVLCNACGLFLKLHGRPRPISLKSDVIKSRNRVKTSQPKKRDSQGGQDGSGLVATNGYSAAHPDAGHAATHAPGGLNGHQHGFPMGNMTGHVGEPSPGSRSNTPSLHQQHSTHHSIAPQHIFDTVSLPSDTFASPSLPAFNLRQPSPAPTANGHGSHMSASSNYEELVTQNNTLRTRVSELEVINDLFRGRVSELEASEQDARQKERSKDAEAQRLLAELATANARAAELQRQLRSLEEGPARKKTRTESDSGRDTISEPGSASAE